MRHLFLLLVVAVPAFARIATVPFAPATGIAFDLFVHGPCGGRVQRTSTNDFVIRVYLESGAVGCDPPTLVTFAQRMRMPKAGEYRVEVHVDNSNEIAESGSFVVRDGAPPFTVSPFAVPTNASPRRRITIESAQPLCAPKCPLVAVDGFYLQPEEVTGSEHTVTFFAPEHEPGLVDVKVKSERRVMNAGGALYYFDRDAAPPLQAFERVLLPVLDASDGANGSRWVTEVAVRNRGAARVETFHSLGPKTIPPRARAAIVADGYPRGTALLVPVGDADDLAFSLRVRDLSRQGESFGTQVPVVRERDLFTNGELTLLDVPVDPRYRTKLRLYAFDLEGATAAIASVRHEPGHGAREETLLVPMSRSCSGDACAWTPFAGEVEVPAGDAGEQVTIYVSLGDGAAPAWAFASVTNNETQHVTLVVPDGRGGRPCDSCEVR